MIEKYELPAHIPFKKKKNYQHIRHGWQYNEISNGVSSTLSFIYEYATTKIDLYSHLLYG